MINEQFLAKSGYAHLNKEKNTCITENELQNKTVLIKLQTILSLTGFLIFAIPATIVMVPMIRAYANI